MKKIDLSHQEANLIIPFLQKRLVLLTTDNPGWEKDAIWKKFYYTPVKTAMLKLDAIHLHRFTQKEIEMMISCINASAQTTSITMENGSEIKILTKTFLEIIKKLN